MDYLMGIDLGSTSLKAVVDDLEGNTLASACRPTELIHPEYAEWFEIYRHLYPALKGVNRQLP